MENQLQKQDKTLLTFLAAGITTGGNIDVANVDKMGINLELRKFKGQGGSPNYGELIKIPMAERIPALAEKDMRGAVTTIAVALTLAFETLNLKQGMNALQIVDLAEVIVDSAVDDQIAIPDLMLFLQKLTRGECGELYGSIDSLKFMGFFNKFRDERWQEGIKIRDAKDTEYKNLGDPERQGRKMNAFDEHLSKYTTELSAKKDEIRELRAERKRNSQ